MVNVSSKMDGSVFGYFVSLVLFGITIVQSWTYFHKNQDAWPLRTFVIILVILDFAQTTCATYNIHYYLISHFGEMDTIAFPNILMTVDFSITSVTFFLVHLFFARRIWKLRKGWWPSIIITFMSVAMLAIGGGAVYFQVIGHVKPTEFHPRRILILSSLFHAVGVFTDILITASLSWVLSRVDTGFKSTRTVLHHLLIYTMTRGILVSLVQIGHIAMYVVHPNDVFFWASLHLILTKLYVLTTLVTLNSRMILRDTLQNTVTDNYRLSFAPPAPPHTFDEMELDRMPKDLVNAHTCVGSSIAQSSHGLESESLLNFKRV